MVRVALPPLNDVERLPVGHHIMLLDPPAGNEHGFGIIGCKPERVKNESPRCQQVGHTAQHRIAVGVLGQVTERIVRRHDQVERLTHRTVKWQGPHVGAQQADMRPACQPPASQPQQIV